MTKKSSEILTFKNLKPTIRKSVLINSAGKCRRRRHAGGSRDRNVVEPEEAHEGVILKLLPVSDRMYNVWCNVLLKEALGDYILGRLCCDETTRGHGKLSKFNLFSSVIYQMQAHTLSKASAGEDQNEQMCFSTNCLVAARVKNCFSQMLKHSNWCWR